jgi:hypothetical protein
VTGSHVSFDPFNTEHTPVHAVGRPIRSVRLAGFDVRGFSGPDVAVVGGSDVRVEHNHLAASPRYGVLSVGSRNTHVIDNSVTGGPIPGFFIGVCVDDKSGAEVRHNEVSGQIVALCIETPGTTVDANQVHDNCSGIFVEGVDAKVTGNHVYNNNECPELPAEQGIALTLAGSRGAVVRHNVFEGHTASVTGGAAVVITDGPTIATGNVVSRNQFRGNTLDLASFSAGRNRIDRNDCSSSIPEQLCS